MQREELKRARQQLTGGMPKGSYDMAGMEFSVTHKAWDGVVAELMAWPKQEKPEPNYRDLLI